MKQDKATTERHSKLLRELLKLPENRICADCKRNDPRWASWNIGVFICIRCSGIHRSMGTHISRVKSIDLDVWTAEQIESMQKWGNTRANVYWEGHLKSGHVPPDHKIDSFIRSKYESRRWVMEGPVPTDPQSSSTSSQPIDTNTDSILSLSPSLSPSNHKRYPNSESTTIPQRQLLSSDILSVTRAPMQKNTQIIPDKAPDDLFSLDFNPPSANTSHAEERTTKNDILSLFNKPIPPNNYTPTIASALNPIEAQLWSTSAHNPGIASADTSSTILWDGNDPKSPGTMKSQFKNDDVFGDVWADIK